mmetsp:Transcript_18732/g.44629  ORF Transcript_18732/g.44629 Transcript_18732/m.44629 type:complete len:263 (-) Transcript_18732:573-1361(-)
MQESHLVLPLLLLPLLRLLLGSAPGAPHKLVEVPGVGGCVVDPALPVRAFHRQILNEGLELLGVEGLAARVDKGADPVLVRRRRRVRVPVLVPVPVLRVTLLCVRVTMFVTMRRMRVTVAVAVGGRVSLRLLSEAHCAANVLVVVRSSRRAALAPEHLLQRDVAELAVEDAGARVERVQDVSEELALFVVDAVCFVEDDLVCAFHLLHKQVHHLPLNLDRLHVVIPLDRSILSADELLAVCDVVPRAVEIEEMRRVDDCDHR